MYHPYVYDADGYLSYYTSQAGGDLAGFSGSSAQYGAGLGGIFKGIFRTVFPLLKKGFAIAKPHLKAAGKGIISDVVANAMIGKQQHQQQEGSGMIALNRRPIKRPPGKKGGGRTVSAKRRRKHVHKKRGRTSNNPRRVKRRKSVHHKAVLKDIF